MIAVFDNFIQDENLLKEIQNNYNDIFKDPGVYKWWDGWWNSSVDNTTKKIIDYAWGDNCPISKSFPINGFEYWTGIQTAKNVDSHWEDDLKIHFDKDEEWYDKTGEIVVPVMGSVYYPSFQNFEGGELEVYTDGEQGKPETVKAKPNRFVIFEAGRHPHAVKTVTKGTRNAIAINLWENAPYSKQIGKLTIE